MNESEQNDLDDRVIKFNTMQLPGQPMGMHMGTSYLVNDLWREVERLRKENQHYARQVLWRTEDMPADAIGWFRGKSNFPHWAIRFDTGYTDGVQVNGPVAPEFRPDEEGPIFLPILDPPA